MLLVIDQLPQWAFIAKRPVLKAGFVRLLTEGEWHTGQHPSGATLTAPGHALLGTGRTPSEAGVLANEWWDRTAQKAVFSVDGPAVGQVSAHRLRVPGLGDAVAAAKSGAKAVGVSLKDRAAILPLGHAGLAIWYDKKLAAFTAANPPAWLAKLPAIRPRLAPWTPLDPKRLATLSGDDAITGEFGEKGFGATFPHDPAKTKDPADAVYAMPLGNELVLETALAAVANEQLGTDATADLLIVSLSPHDYVGHGWGQESWEEWDLVMRLDRQLDEFLAGLDRAVGSGEWAMIMTSDHGAAPMPARNGRGHTTYEALQRAANTAASLELGPGQWVANAKYPNIFLTPAALARPAKQLAPAMKRIMLAVRAFPGVERVGRTADLAGNCSARTGDAKGICLMLDPERSGELFWLPRDGWIHHDEEDHYATAHGSFHAYDREVPLIVLAPGRTPHPPPERPDSTVVVTTTVATTLTEWLRVRPPTKL